MSVERLRAAEPLDEGPALLEASCCRRATIAGSRSMKAASWFATKGTSRTSATMKTRTKRTRMMSVAAEPAEAEPLQPVGEGIEQVGEREAGHEGQEDVAEDEQRPGP